MNLRKAAAAVAGGIGLVAGANALLARRTPALGPPLPGTEHTYRWRGMDVAYTELGDPDAPDLLLLHGINAAGSSKEFDGVAEGLAEEYHVLAPDLPGFGRSDRPALEYDDELYTDFVADFATDVAEAPIGVASSLTGAYAAIAQRRTGAFSRLVLITPTATTMPTRRPLVRRALRTPVLGQTVYGLLTSRAGIRYFSADHGYYDPARKPREWGEYQWRAARQPGARFAPASFISGYLDPPVELGGVLADLGVPVTLVWGRETELTPLSYGRDLAERADARLVVFDRAKLQPHVEHADRFLTALRAELADEDVEATVEAADSAPGSDTPEPERRAAADGGDGTASLGLEE